MPIRFPLYRILRDEYPCFWIEDAGMWVLSRHADISAALANWRSFSSAHGNLMDELPNRAGATLGTTDPPRHDRLRALIQHAFMKRNLDTLVEPTRQIAVEAIAELEDRDDFDFIADFSSKVTPRILFLMLGLPPGNDREVRDKAVLMVQSDPASRRKGPEHIAAYEWMMSYAAGVIAERRAHPGTDLISQFVIAEIDGWERTYEGASHATVLVDTNTFVGTIGHCRLINFRQAVVSQKLCDLINNEHLSSDGDTTAPKEPENLQQSENSYDHNNYQKDISRLSILYEPVHHIVKKRH